MEKEEVLPDNMVPKSYLPLFVENYYWDPQYEFRDQTVKAREKIANRRVSSLASWIADKYFKQARSFPKIKVKLNESRLLKFCQVKQQKENSTENSAEKNFKEDSQFNELWNISTKQKRKEKYSNSKNFVSRTLSQINSSNLH